MHSLVWSAGFTRSAERFVKRYPELREKLAAVLRDLECDPFQGGKLKGLQAVSLTYDYRITLTVMVTDKEITLLDIGSQGEVYR